MIYCLYYQNKSASNQMSTAVVSTTQVCDAETIVLGNTELINCVSDDRTCDHSWLAVFLRKHPRVVRVT